MLSIVVLALISNAIISIKSLPLLRMMTTCLATVTLVAPVISLTALNIFAVAATPSFLPSTIRRVVLGVTPGPGMWIAIAGGCLTTIAAIGAAPGFVRSTGDALRRLVHGDRTVVAVSLALAGALIYLISRYQPWVSLNLIYTGDQRSIWVIPGFAIPVVGIVSIFEIAAIIFCAAWQVTRPSLGTATAMTAVGFAPLFYGAIGSCLHLVPRNFHVAIPRSFANSLAQWSPSAERLSNGYLNLPHLNSHLSAEIVAGPGGVWSLVAGVLVTFSGLVLIHTHKSEGAML